MTLIRSVLFLFLFSPVWVFSQDCNLTLKGIVLDKSTGSPLPFATIFLEDQKKGAVSDSLGTFYLDQLCTGDYHVQISHIGCEGEERFLKLTKDTVLSIYLHHHTELLDEVVVHGSRGDNSTQASSTLGREEIEQNSHKNLSDLLENITGVSTLKNGSGISKPVIHGLYGNRVAILNNGIQQSGQQWGNDHAPEIDPFVADHISVVKGASALVYGGNSLGAVVLVEADDISSDPHLHGNVNYTFQTNGLGHSLNTQLEKNSPWAAWRVSSTLKMQGDTNTPDYFLTNTGKREANLAVQLKKDFNERWFNELYLSTFNAEIGVLRGSHVGNLTDLEDALVREVPFFTADEFSYQINAPRQRVGHHLIKIESKYFFNEKRLLKFKYGGQLNDRKEYDIRRSGRSDIPALSLRQFSNFVELAYHHHFENQSILKSGLQYRYVDNINNPETDILPLIPNYDEQNIASFLIYQQEKDQWLYEIGARYDLKLLDVFSISQSIPRVIERFDHTFHNYAFSGGLKYKPSSTFKIGFNSGYMLRAPEVNELYSVGLHQGVSGIEEGTRTLKAEQSLKNVLSLDWYFKNKLFVQALIYHQVINDYIYLQPQDEFRLTIRGAFPVFIYEQTDARIQGADFLISYEPTSRLKWLLKYAHINGTDIKNNSALINIPADNLSTTFTFLMNDLSWCSQNSISLNGKYVFEQEDILEEQDFLAPPDGYFLLGLNFKTKLQLNKRTLSILLRVENLLNTPYRDYLNRLRYFANEPGINVSVNLKYDF